MVDGKTRCGWASHPLEIEYHDKEWGRPLHDDRALFELLILEGMQAGLSWLTVLKKRDAFRQALDGFDPSKIANYGDRKIEELLQNPDIIRNRLKVRAAVTNARAYLRVVEEYGSFDRFIWRYVDGGPIVNHWRSMRDIPAKTALSDTISKDMKKLGFQFVGSTIIYAFMQSTGMVEDHVEECFVKQSIHPD